MLDEAISVRTERVRPARPTRYGGGTSLEARLSGSAAADPIVVIDGEPTSSPLVERWRRLRVVWEQTTFYLFSPDSWRR